MSHDDLSRLSSSTIFLIGTIFLIMFLIGAAIFWATTKLVNQIRTHYPDLYDNVGRPSLLLSERRSIIEQWRFVRFLFRRDYNRLDDMKLTMLGDVFFWQLDQYWTSAVCDFPSEQTVTRAANHPSATFSTSLPKFSPLNSLSSVSGKFSRPSTMSSRDFSLPAAIQPAISWTACG
jgi:hypothetical protein